jgi:acyl carrier protein
MNEAEVLSHIRRVVTETIEDKGHDAPPIELETEMLGGDLPIDSLDLATIISGLEQAIGFDPFAKGFIEFRTVGELVKLYVK